MENRLIFAVDDEQSIRELYDFALESAGYGVKCFTCADELFAELETTLPDLFLLDVMLDGADGYEILKRLRANAKTADIPVIMVSAKTEEIDKVKGLNLGADDYLCKPFGVLELVARINSKLRKIQSVNKAQEYKGVEIDKRAHTVYVCGRQAELTKKQYELLETFMSAVGKTFSRDELLDAVWGVDYGQTRTLDIHIGELRKIISPSEARIITVRGVGYKFI